MAEVRLIDADALRKKAREMDMCQAVTVWDIDEAPTISPDSLRPKGRWEAYPSDAYMRCSVCKREYLKAKMPDEVGYCPNPHCGADMREMREGEGE